MYRSLRYLAIIFVMAPAMVLARQATDRPSTPPAPTPPALPAPPCPESAVAIVQPRVHVAQPPVHFVRPGQPTVSVKYDAEKRKTFEKTYKVNSSDILNIENKYGRVHVNTWDKKEIKVKVDMIARAGSENRANDLLNRMQVDEAREGNTIYLKTVYEPGRNSGMSSSEINYTIYMPESNAITLKNTYGDVYLAALKGKADVTMKYGNLKCDRLANANNALKLTYGSGSCSYINGGTLQLAYFDLNAADARSLNGYSKYSDLTIGRLAEGITMEMKYGSFRVNNISNSIKNIKLASTYIPIMLNFADNTAFDFDVNVQYGDFKVNKDLVNITSMEKDYTSADYKGKFGNSSSKAAVSITSKYGDVRFTQ
ncbi:DUF4097 family beta strand repeat protein [Pontibacter sp. Tf4]|uniref:DUF4097 family beta strand repeat-containing protein n=1 Tax=Pontibacter sp. Tf4 TaxID=2761620 RepID=UPI0016282826|nr:DUF4097 family beta strand repeat-containing protein [Pontibacter sp. Tf4]MBB6611321.1 DUF4097 family beta strand repeat protein [Pontibacter sp. Tf4]